MDEKEKGLNETARADNAGVSQVRDTVKFDKHGQVSLRVSKKAFAQLTEMQGLFTIRFRKSYTMGQTMDTVVDMMHQSMRAFEAIKAIDNAERETATQ